MSRASPKFRGRVVVWPVLVLVLVLLLPIVRAMPTPPHNRPPGNSPHPESTGGDLNSEPIKLVEVIYEVTYPGYPVGFKKSIIEILKSEHPGDSEDDRKFLKDSYALVSPRLKIEQWEIIRVTRKVNDMAMTFLSDVYNNGWGAQLRAGGVKYDANIIINKEERAFYPSYELKPGDDVHLNVKWMWKYDGKLINTENWLVTLREKKGCKGKVVGRKVMNGKGATYPVLPEEEESGSSCSVM
ncbi:hypothetical protein EV360DRAFT_84513 [Lentinula raphanica]|nr:hypothetical protein EV360DRAFT_84513 [Lentinula raphanica]